MAGRFEIIGEAGGGCRVRLVDERGRELAVSIPYGNSQDAVEGIHALREIAGTALIEDCTSDTACGPAALRGSSGAIGATRTPGGAT